MHLGVHFACIGDGIDDHDHVLMTGCLHCSGVMGRMSFGSLHCDGGMGDGISGHGKKRVGVKVYTSCTIA